MDINKIKQEIPIKSFCVCAFICKKTQKEVKYLIIKRCSKTYNNSWQMVSGKVEKGEKGWEAALREIKEETGIIPEYLYSANKVECFYEVNQNCINLVPVFIAFVNENVEVKLNESEHDDYRWVTKEEAPDYLIFSNHIELIEYLDQNFVKKNPNPLLKVIF
jgi:dihydroneopterin triphosphate diphosphatase